MFAVTDQIRKSFRRALNSPAGGMLACLLIAALLGGVAAANPGGKTNENSSPAAQEQEAADETTEAIESNGATPGEHTEADCEALREDADLPDEEEATGLEHAIYMVSENCANNRKAPGLLVALDRLTRNLERHQEHQAEMAERKAQEHGRSGDAPGRSGEAPGQSQDHPSGPSV